ncbi:hypothetical protein MAHJHV60_47250 [Mycobacterium avium subsp. hominissuis]
MGRLDVVEDRLVGIKSREIYEAPHPLGTGAGVECLDGAQHRHRLAVDGHRNPALEPDDHLVGGAPVPTIRNNALYMDRYPLVSAISRPLIADTSG